MKDKLQQSLKKSLKAKDTVKRDTIRSLLSSIQYAEMESSCGSLDESQFISIAKSEVKKRSEEIEYAVKADRNEDVERLKREQEIIKEFLPNQLSEQQLKSEIEKIASRLDSPSIGSVMKELKTKFEGQYDGRIASGIIKEKL